MSRVQRSPKRIIGLVAPVVVALLLVLAWLAVRPRPAHPPYPDSLTYRVLFSWDGGVKTLIVINEKTGQEEKNSELRRMIATEARKTLPSAVEHLGLQRAEGPLYCRLAGSRELYAVVCAPAGEGATSAYDIYDPDTKKPLLVAVRNSDVVAIQELIHSGTDINAADQHGWTALMRAAQLEDTVALRTLVAAGPDLDARNSEGQTALIVAVNQMNLRATEVLITAGADVNVADNKGWTALMEADTPEIVRALLAAGADVNATNHDGETALMLAALFGTPARVKALLTARPNLNIRSKDGHTALDLAKSAGKPDVVALLRNAGHAQ